MLEIHHTRKDSFVWKCKKCNNKIHLFQLLLTGISVVRCVLQHLKEIVSKYEIDETKFGKVSIYLVTVEDR